MVILYIGILANFVGALVRYILAVGLLAFGTSRIDQPILPEWILKLLWIDASNATYNAAIIMHHNHNHPIFVTLAMRLCT